VADRTSAEIFSVMFEYLAKSPQDARTKKMADYLWSAASGYDFDAYQMGCDKALLKLGLASMGLNPEYPEDGETIIYRDRDR
jgi:hypothetical protein